MSSKLTTNSDNAKSPLEDLTIRSTMTIDDCEQWLAAAEAHGVDDLEIMVLMAAICGLNLA